EPVKPRNSSIQWLLSQAGRMEGFNMTIQLRVKRPDPVLKQIVSALRDYDKAHPVAKIEAYRQNSVSVRNRILNPEFANTGRAEREEVWAGLEKLPEEVMAE